MAARTGSKGRLRRTVASLALRAGCRSGQAWWESQSGEPNAAAAFRDRVRSCQGQMEEGRPLGGLFTFVRRVLAQFDVEAQIHRKLDWVFSRVRVIPVILIVAQHQAVADHLLSAVH